MEIPARVTILGETPVMFDGDITPIGKTKILLRSPRAVALRTLLKLEAKDCLWMGEVVECRAEGQAWIADVCVEHVLRGLAELRQMAERFLGTARRDRESVEHVQSS